MSVKTKLGAAIALTSLGAIASVREQAAKLIADAEAAEQTLKVKAAEDVTAEITASRARIAKILGRPEFSLGELLPVVTALKNDKPLFAFEAKNGNTGQLTPEKREQVKDAMKARAAALKAGTVPETISAICERLSTTAQTCGNYKPTKAEVDLMPGTAEVPAHAYLAAPAAS